NVWRYDLEPSGDGTDVTESFELKNTPWLRLYWALLGWARGKTNEHGMRTTLERIKAAVETEPSRGG
ncbi:MAG: SRPBCC family protein, partial [Acidimicrobiia bacterium]